MRSRQIGSGLLTYWRGEHDTLELSHDCGLVVRGVG